MLNSSEREVLNFVGISLEKDSDVGILDLKSLKDCPFEKNFSVGRITNLSSIPSFDKQIKKLIKTHFNLVESQNKFELFHVCLNEFYLVSILVPKKYRHNLKVTCEKNNPFIECSYKGTHGYSEIFHYLLTPLELIRSDYDDYLVDYLTKYDPKAKVSKKYRESCQNILFWEKSTAKEAASFQVWRQRIPEFMVTKPQSEMNLCHLTFQ